MRSMEPSFTTASCRTGASAHGRSERVPGTFPAPTGLAYGHQGNLYVSEWSAHRVRRIDRASGTIRTLRGRIGSPAGIAVEADGQVLVASYDEGVVYRLRPEEAPWPALQPEPEVVVSTLGGGVIEIRSDGPGRRGAMRRVHRLWAWWPMAPMPP